MAAMIPACGPSSEQAASYNEAIVEEQNSVLNSINAVFESTVNYKDIPAMDNALNKARQQANMSLDVIKKMNKFDGSTQYRDDAVRLFEVYQSVTMNELSQIVDLYKLPDEKYTEKEKLQIDSLVTESTRKMDEALAYFKTSQENFAKKYKLKIE
jgi:hypothetical protein